MQGLEGIATQVAGAVEKTAAGLESGGAANGLNGLAAGSALATGQEPEVPKGYLNYLLYDEEYHLIDQGFQQVSEAAAVGKANPSASPEALALEVPIEREGYLYTYLSNEPSASATAAVYFDDFTVEQQSYIVQVDDYYPFGLTFEQPLGDPTNKYLYNGKELQEETGWYDFGARMYDPTLGRWMSVDPLSDEFSSHAVNNPIRFIDPDGQAPFDPNCPGCPPPSGSQVVYEGRQQFVDESIEYFTGMVEGIKTVLGFTEADDATVLTTGRHIDGNQASGFEYVTAGVGIFLPVSGKTISKLSGKGSDILEGFVRKVGNQAEHLTDLDVAGAIRDIQGNPVIRSSDGHVYDHLGEVTDAMKGLGNQLNKLNKSIDSGELTGDVLEEAQRLRSDVQIQKDNIQNLLNKAGKWVSSP